MADAHALRFHGISWSREPGRHTPQEIVRKKALKPRQRRELERWTQTVFALSSRCTSGLMVIKPIDYEPSRPKGSTARGAGAAA
jgi:hypothetical protein